MSPQAVIDTQQIYEYILVRFFSKDSARKIKDLILKKIDNLNYMPYRFKECIKDSGIRSVRASNYLIIYNVNEKSKEVYIQRIVYCRIDIDELLNKCDA